MIPREAASGRLPPEGGAALVDRRSRFHGARLALFAMLSADDLRRLTAPGATPPGCACEHLQCAGWESISQPLTEPLLRHLGTLRDPAIDEPTFEEWPGPGYWSPQAAVAPTHFPYNRCEVWACVACGRGFLQYTEFGGYYVDHRLRQIDPAQVV